MTGFFLFLATLSLSWSVGRAKVPSSARGRELEGTVLTAPCTLYLRISEFANGRWEQSWKCVLDPADGVGVVSIPKGLNLSSAVSGETTLTAPGMAVGDNATAIVDPTEAVFGTRRRRDRRLTIEGDKNVVVVRVTCGTNQVTTSLTDIMANVFSDAVCLKSQMAACSNNLVSILEGYNGGGVEVTVPDTDCTENAVTQELLKISGDPFSGDTHFMYCLPPGALDRKAYAYVGGKISVYNDEWCNYVSSPMHEFGHNFGLAHAGDAYGDTYGDNTGFMGALYDIDDQAMCYNAAHMYQLGWLTNIMEFTARPSSDTYTLVGHTNFESDAGVQALRLKGAPTSGEDTYIWFNDIGTMNPRNVDSPEGRNRVIITTRVAGTDYAQTFTAAILDVNGFFSPSGAYYAVQVISIANGQAVITFAGSPPTSPPTTAAPIPPTEPPTEAPPTTSPPTPSPVPAPTRAPVRVRTTVPVARPTRSPRISGPRKKACPKTRKRKLCPPGCVFKGRRCRAQKG